MSAKQILLDFLPTFLHSQFFVTPSLPPPSTSLTGQTVIVTGANTGLGKEAARHFARLGAAKVILTCRNTSKGQDAKLDIENSLPDRKGVVQVWELDYNDYESVKAFVKRCDTDLERVDILVENAGIATNDFKIVAGHEATVTVNVVSTFLLALGMLPVMQKTARKFNKVPTLSVVASEVQFVSPFKERLSPRIFDALDTESKADMGSRYPTSKLLEVLTIREIARLHPVNKTHVTINALNPGLCHSELMREQDGFGAWLFKRVLARTTDVGARTLVNAGLSGEETHGKYMSDCKVAKVAPLIEGEEGPELQKRFWGELQEELEKIQPGVTKVLSQ